MFFDEDGFDWGCVLALVCLVLFVGWITSFAYGYYVMGIIGVVLHIGVAFSLLWYHNQTKPSKKRETCRLRNFGRFLRFVFRCIIIIGLDSLLSAAVHVSLWMLYIAFWPFTLAWRIIEKKHYRNIPPP